MAKDEPKLSGRKLRNAWDNMFARCYDPSHRSYCYYGVRGIGVCDSWSSFDNFKKDMAPTIKVGLSLDRINSDKDYCKTNCRWVTPKEQSDNRRNNKIIEYFGVSDNLNNWADFLGLPKGSLYRRLIYSKWSLERSFNGGKKGYIYA